MTGEQLKAIREKLALTGAEFACVLGYINHGNVYKFESGERDIPDDVACLAVVLNLHGVPDTPAFKGSTVRRLICMLRSYGVPNDSAFTRLAVYAD